jgi:hypothetical protein
MVLEDELAGCLEAGLHALADVQDREHLPVVREVV